MIRSIKNAGNTVYVLHSLIKKLKIQVSSFTIEKDLLDHPDYPSLLAISDCLTSWNIPNEAFKINKEVCDVKELPFPFIAHLKREGGEFVLIQGIEADKVSFSNEKKKRGDLKQSEFLKFWDGIILFAEKDEDSGEKEYNQSLIKGWINETRLPFLILILLCWVFYTINFGDTSLSYLSLVLIKLTGIGVCGLLLTHSINANNPLVKNLCSLGEKNNCNGILKSDAAKVTSWLSWSEVGMFYFAGSLIYLLLNPSGILALSCLNILCLPYTIYSISYQIKIKNLCVLCCFVQTLLWMEAIVFFVYGISFQPLPLNMRFSDIISISMYFLVPIAIWGFIKPYLLKSERVKSLNQQLKKFKYNSTLFNQLLGSQTKYSIPDDLMPITIGNPEANTVITMVSNPFCDPCGVAHKTLQEWLNQRNDIQLKVLFVTANHEDDALTKVASHITSLSLSTDKVVVEEALNDWYNQSSKNYDSWAEKHPISNREGLEIAIQKQKEWCEMAEIQFTPTIFINGYKLTDPYSLDDIKYLLM
jgi:glutaredoxin